MRKERPSEPGDLTQKQREAILERNGHTSILRHYSEEKGWHQGGYCADNAWKKCDDLHVHHIKPQGQMKFEGSTRDERQDPRNLASLFSCEHSGICKKQKMIKVGKK